MPNRSDLRAGFSLALLSSAAFGVLPVLGKIAFAEGFDVPTLLVWRFSIAGVLIGGLALVRARGSGIPPARRAALLGLGVLYAVNSGLYFLALERIPATTTSLVFYVYPAIVAAIGVVFLRRSLRPLQAAALSLALVGVALTVGFARGPLDPTGVWLALIAAGIVAVYFTLGELALADVPTVPATAFVMSGTALAYWAFAAVAGGLALPPTPRGWLLVSIMATFSTALSLVAMFGAIRRIGAGATAVVGTLEPAVTAAFAAALLGETLAPRQLAGGALILLGVLLLRVASGSASPALADA